MLRLVPSKPYSGRQTFPRKKKNFTAQRKHVYNHTVKTGRGYVLPGGYFHVMVE